MPLFSIIVPVYNVEEYLPACVESILDQSFTDFELILVDDGSQDRSGAMCDTYAERDARVRVIHKANGGVSSARNCGIEVTTGSWIWFVDSDDYIESCSLEQFRSTILLNQACLYVFNCRGVQESFKGDFEAFLHRYYFTYVLGFGSWNKLFNAELVHRNRLRFDEQETVGEDLLFNIQYYSSLFRDREEGHCCFLGRDYYHYVDRVGSAMNTKSKIRFSQQLRLYDKIKKILSGKIKSSTLSYFFLLHLISGLQQAKQGGLTCREFASVMKSKEYHFEIKQSRKDLHVFFKNEQSSLLGKIRIQVFLLLLDQKQYYPAGRIIGLKG